VEIKRILLQNFKKNEAVYKALITSKNKNCFLIKLSSSKQKGKSFYVKIIKWEPAKQIIFLNINQKIYKARFLFDAKSQSTSINLMNAHGTKNFSLKISNPSLKNKNYLPASKDSQISNISLCSPIAGKVIKCYVQPNQKVQKNQRLLIIESMKMENEIRAKSDAFIKTIPISEGDLVEPNQVLIKFKKKFQKHINTKGKLYEK